MKRDKYKIRKSNNGIQYFIMELYMSEWKISKVYYSFNKAKLNLLKITGEIQKWKKYF